MEMFIIGRFFSLVFQTKAITSTDQINSQMEPMNDGANYDLSSLETSDLSTLISILENHSPSSNLVREHLKRRVANRSIEIITYADGFKPPNSVEERDKYIRIENLQLASKLLKYSGQFISHIRIDHHNFLKNEMMKTIFQCISLYCFETLTRLHITNGPGNCFNAITNPLKSVEIVSLHGDFDRLGNSELSFSEMLPSLRRLSLGKIFVNDMNWVDYVYPNLEYLNAPICKDIIAPRRFTEVKAERFLRGNSHIRSLELWKASPKLLKFVADELKDLKYLELHNCNREIIDAEANASAVQNDGAVISDKTSIHFDKLKVLKIEFGSHGFPEHMSFEALEELYIICLPRQTCQEWIKFVENYNKLRKLYVDHRLTNADIHRLAAANLKLIEIVFKCDSNVESGSLVELIKNGEFKKIQLIVPHEESMDAMLKDLQGELNEEWIIINENELEISIQRKKLQN